MTEGILEGLLAMLVAVCSLWIVGMLAGRALPEWADGDRWLRMVWGLAVFIVAFGLAEQFGMWMGQWTMIAGWILFCLLLYIFGRFRKRRKVDEGTTHGGGLPWWLWVQGGMLMSVHALVATATSLMGPPGMGVFGYRAKLWWLAGRTPDGYYKLPGYDFSYPDYPTGCSLLTFWTAVWRGRWEDHWVKLWIPICVVLVWRLTVGWMRERGMRWWCVLAPGVFLMGEQVLEWSRWYYGEALVMVLSGAGIMMILDGRRQFGAIGWKRGAAGLFLLACCAWVKNEGVLYWLAGLVVYLVLWRQRWLAGFISMPVALGWRVAMALRGSKSLDYDWIGVTRKTSAENILRLKDMIDTVTGGWLRDWTQHMGLWWLLPLVVMLSWRKTEARIWLVTSLICAAGLWCVYFFSVLPMSTHGLSWVRITAPLAYFILLSLCSGISGESENKRIVQNHA